jgi:hypothetical protein
MLNARYVVPALAVGLVLLALGRLPPTPVLLVLAALVAANQVPRTLQAGFEWPVDRSAQVIAAGATAVALLGIVIGSRAVRPAVLACSAVLVGLVAVGYVQDSHRDDRYRGDAVALPVSVLYPWAQGVHGSRVALTGDLFQLPFYGPDLSNHVQYIGVPGPHGAFLAATSCRAWRTQLELGHYDFVVISPTAFASQVEPQREQDWLESDPDAVVVAGEGTARAYRLDGPIEPSECPG